MDKKSYGIESKPSNRKSYHFWHEGQMITSYSNRWQDIHRVTNLIAYNANYGEKSYISAILPVKKELNTGKKARCFG